MVEVGEEKLSPEKIGTARPYFRKQSFYFRHLSFGNVNIVSHFRRIGDFSLLSAFKRNFLYFVLEIGTIGSKENVLHSPCLNYMTDETYNRQYVAKAE